MAHLAAVTLRDGSQVSWLRLQTTQMDLKVIAKENRKALHHLVDKCRGEWINDGCDDSRAILIKWALVDDNGEVSEEVRKIVLNSIVLKGASLKWVNPVVETISMERRSVAKL